jgi:hypothetical protein
MEEFEFIVPYSESGTCLVKVMAETYDLALAEVKNGGGDRLEHEPENIEYDDHSAVPYDEDEAIEVICD